MGEKEIKIEDMVNRDYQYGFKNEPRTWDDD
jgi:hypothetical protein